MKKIVSLSLAWSFLILAVTGVVLYVDPPGRIAYWGDWTLLGMNKEEWGNFHIIFGFFMIVAALFHVTYNWKPLLSYMKDRVTRALTATRELVVSLVVVAVVAAATYFQLPPLSWVLQFGEQFGEGWEHQYGSPPFNHAELTNLKQFCARMGLDHARALETLKAHGVVPRPEESLKDTGRRHGLSPQSIYLLIKDLKSAEAPPEEAIPPRGGSGMGKKSLEQVCELRNVPLDAALARMKAAGIHGDPDQRFREIAEEAGIIPSELLRIIETR